jgi:circadian clock protein KaiB
LIRSQTNLPKIFKGIALFTPGGDLIYGIDPNKQAQWHINLCVGLQEILGLVEPPHFLIPGYTATVERWLNPRTQKIETIAEVYPAVQCYRSLLKVLFETEDTVWQIAPWQEEYCDSLILETYRSQFPQLWQDHDLVICLNPQNYSKSSEETQITANISTERTLSFNSNSSINHSKTDGYILQLFVSSDNLATEKTLASIHQILEEGLTSPYTLKIIDISKYPEQAEKYQVSATPTLVRVSPEPIRRIIGELDDFQRVIKIISSS